MSRSRAGILPTLKQASPPPPEDIWNTPRADSRAYGRIDNLEGRLTNQEKTSQTLLDRAYKVQEDIINNLEYSHGSWQEEKKARVLLQEHIRTITDVTRKLSKDIMLLEEQQRHKSLSQDTTSTTMKNLEVASTSGITELRGRVGRCDASLSKLSAELKACYDGLRSVGQTQAESSAGLTEKIHGLDAKFNTVINKLDKLSTEHSLQLRHVESDSTHQVSALDARTRALIEDTKGAVSTLRASEHSERERLEARISGMIEKALGSRDIAMEKMDRKMEEQVRDLMRKVAKLEEDLARERDNTSKANEASQRHLEELLSGHVRRQSEDIAKLKHECRDGFSTVHESITNMKEVVDGKRRLLEEQMRREISQIRKMVVLI